MIQRGLSGVRHGAAFRRCAFALLASAFSLLGPSACITPPPSGISLSPVRKPVATGPFWWGISTSSYQNEDRAEEPSSPNYFQTDWDIYARQGHAPARGDFATRSWTHFERDLHALKALDVNHYRFSIEWARVEPKPGVFNQAAIDHYVKMARELKASGIEPVVTLWHFTFPDWLYHDGNARKANYLDPRILPAWRNYVTRMVTALRPYVRVFVPENEPNGQLQLAYLAGHFPPGKLLAIGSYKKAMRVSVAMFRDAADIVHRSRPDAIVMGIYALPHWRRNWFEDPTGAVFNTTWRLNCDHLDQVHDVCDLIGVNYYFVQDAAIVRFLTHRGEIGWRYTQLGWEIDAEGLHDVLCRTYRRYGIPLVVTENGLATVSEQKKIRYLREHINQMRRAMADGVDVRGYFPWTLVDNYEWREGWRANFGLTYLQPGDQELTIGTSGKWFAEFVRSHPLP